MFRGDVSSQSQNKCYLIRQIVLMATIFVFALTTMFSLGTFAVAAEENSPAAETATPGDAAQVTDGLHYDEQSGKWYLYKNGVPSAAVGWTTVDSATRVLVSGTDGVVTKKLSVSGDVRKLYVASGENWILQKNVWQEIDTNQYYFASSGICARIYYTNSKQLYIYSNGKMVLAKNTAYSLHNNKLYLFNGNGVRVTTSGWHVANAAVTYYVSGSGYITHRLLKSGNNYTYAHYDYAKKAWVNEKNCWKTFLGKSYYFASSGICTRLYNVNSKRLYVYSGGKLVLAKNNIYKLNNNKWYFFNGKGIKVTKSGWNKINSKNYVYTTKSGYVTLKYKQSGNVKKLYQYNYKTNKWTAKKNSWQTIANSTYSFNAKGTATLMYNTKTKKCYDFKNKKWTLVKKQTRKIQGKTYYFNAKGKKVTKAGSYKTSDGYIAYVNKKGVVSKIELDLTYSRYYTIKLANGKTTKVYGHYDIKAAEAIMNEVNRYRQERHESTLSTKASLTKAANTRAVEITNTYGHTRPDGTLCINSIAALYGENIAAGFSSVDDVVWAWKRSQGHNENMLKSDYKYLAVSVFVAEKKDKEGYKYYYVQAFGK